MQERTDTQEGDPRGERESLPRSHENYFNSHSLSVDVFNWLRGSRGKKITTLGEKTIDQKYMDNNITLPAPETTKWCDRNSGLRGHFNLVMGLCGCNL